MRFGLGVPTATEGMMYPVPFASIEDAIRLATTAESLGFDSVWGNDHLSTQHYVREEFTDPPRFYDPIAYLSYMAAVTTRVRLATAVLVLPFRHPVLVAKQAATLDLLSKGRLVLGVGVGAYREELESTWPGRRVHRGEYVHESLEALAGLLAQRRSSYEGRWISFTDVESFPKPAQDPLPVLSGGNSAGARARAATLAHGWLPACLTPAELAQGVAEVHRHAAADDRVLPSSFEVAPQLVVSMADTREKAVRKFRGSQVYAHLASLGGSTLKNQAGAFEDRNLVGTPEQVREQVGAYAAAGASTLSALLFATQTVEETLEAMQAFAEEVIAPCAGQVAR